MRGLFYLIVTHIYGGELKVRFGYVAHIVGFLALNQIFVLHLGVLFLNLLAVNVGHYHSSTVGLVALIGKKLAQLVAVVMTTSQHLLFLGHPNAVNLLNISKIYGRIVELSNESKHIRTWNLHILCLLVSGAGSHQYDG